MSANQRASVGLVGLQRLSVDNPQVRARIEEAVRARVAARRRTRDDAATVSWEEVSDGQRKS